ncbi:11beta-hydroxysteroid dehydrogenase [Ranunculus cassubicifolius]
MDLVNMFMNLVAPPASLFTLLMFLPSFYFFKWLLSTLRFIYSENVAGKVVLITGASSGIGEELAYQYAKRGACLALVARREDRLREVAKIARVYGSPDVLVVPGDVSKVDDCKRFVEQTVRHFGRLNHLVNNAGILTVSTFEESTNVDNFRPIMDINFWGSIYPTYFAIPYLRHSRGKIVVTASAGGWLPVPRMSVYNASKAALINFYECLRTELGSDVGITIVTPGIIESEMSQGKYLNKEGNMVVDPGTRDALYYWKVFCPEFVEWCNHVLLMTGPDPSQGVTLGKIILNLTGAKYFLYPSSICSPELKED